MKGTDRSLKRELQLRIAARRPHPTFGGYSEFLVSSSVRKVVYFWVVA
jgi:hypothetical protein